MIRSTPGDDVIRIIISFGQAGGVQGLTERGIFGQANDSSI